MSTPPSASGASARPSSFEPALILATERLVLRPFTVADAEAVFEAVDDEVRRWMVWAPGYTREQARSYCALQAHPYPDRGLVRAISAGGRLAGSIGLDGADWAAGRVEIGYWLAPWARGRGYAAEATVALTEYAFGRGMSRVQLVAAVGNTASQRTAERAGFVREGVLRSYQPIPSGRTDMVMYSRLAESAESVEPAR
ncbi:GNAT family N-acetyltransferase [Allonocardiopsis opalescens]|uniref:RimJ/RimL family protein N-acetyltransferase n=1 Tax=Allonocardiopsis opalescens TaxID=1144618 RepID=A0A2T0PXK4_9ACTN|nr:GNAT family N-acetyltransferase [Allonocardiopsis opalescens]PRX96263.1 RimJ/RimL family protein N-acetyltransferase [Allonocardiopsis opalescens]